VDKIANTPVRLFRGEMSQHTEDVRVNSIDIKEQ